MSSATWPTVLPATHSCVYRTPLWKRVSRSSLSSKKWSLERVATTRIPNPVVTPSTSNKRFSWYFFLSMSNKVTDILPLNPYLKSETSCFFECSSFLWILLQYSKNLANFPEKSASESYILILQFIPWHVNSIAVQFPIQLCDHRRETDQQYQESKDGTGSGQLLRRHLRQTEHHHQLSTRHSVAHL